MGNIQKENVIDLLICECGDLDHQLILSYWPTDIFPDQDPEISVNVKLNPAKPWWKRIIIAVKYIFGKKCKYGDFDEIVLKGEDYDKLKNAADYLKIVYDAKQAEKLIEESNKQTNNK